MTDLDALIAAIKAHPLDDTPRLMLADELDERGDALRAEFIRVQCEISRVDDAVAEWGESNRDKTGLAALSNHLGSLRRREKDLLETPVSPGRWTPNWAVWFRDAINGPGVVVTMTGLHRETGAANEFVLTASRGFLSRLRCSWSDWSAHGDRILSDPWVPGLDEVELTTVPHVSRAKESDLAAVLQFRARWPDVRKWTLPPAQGSFLVPPEFTTRLFQGIRVTQEMMDDTTPYAQAELRRLFGHPEMPV